LNLFEDWELLLYAVSARIADAYQNIPHSYIDTMTIRES
jgi:hypothetical protein